jgi:cell shape-determining protein MreC
MDEYKKLGARNEKLKEENKEKKRRSPKIH